jgi:hypothetical protein
VFHAIGVFDRACTLRKLRQFEMHPIQMTWPEENIADFQIPYFFPPRLI